MFLNHAQAFADFTPTPLSATTTFCHGTRLETEAGWRPVEALRAGDRVHTLDGGLVALTGHAPAPAPLATWRVPAGALDNCADLLLAGDQHVALSHPLAERLFEAGVVLTPVAALAGFHGIAPATGTAPAATRLRMASEEIVYAQTGTLLHVAGDDADPFFRRLGYGETRALLSLMAGRHVAPDPRRLAA